MRNERDKQQKINRLAKHCIQILYIYGEYMVVLQYICDGIIIKHTIEYDRNVYIESRTTNVQYTLNTMTVRIHYKTILVCSCVVINLLL